MESQESNNGDFTILGSNASLNSSAKKKPGKKTAKQEKNEKFGFYSYNEQVCLTEFNMDVTALLKRKLDLENGQCSLKQFLSSSLLY